MNHYEVALLLAMSVRNWDMQDVSFAVDRDVDLTSRSRGPGRIDEPAYTEYRPLPRAASQAKRRRRDRRRGQR